MNKDKRAGDAARRCGIPCLCLKISEYSENAPKKYLSPFGNCYFLVEIVKKQ